MKPFHSTLAAALLAASMAATPSTAAPWLLVPPSQPADAVAGMLRLASDRDDRDRNGRFDRRGDHYYFNGHRGFRHYRPGYRYHNGFWFPAAAFIAGAIIGGALASPRGVYRQRYELHPAHVEWCHARYRSYRAWDDTFQPYNGPRRRCRSPYG